ncbi:unnamed protein product [Heterobilharzia americana]|nr:unnamed protein product [Heterobilharzia americana]
MSSVLSHKLEDLQAKTNKLTEEAAKTGLQVNVEKTEVMKIPKQQQHQQQALITTNGRNLKELVSFTYIPRQQSFIYFGSILSTAEGGTDENVMTRIGKPARQAFINLKSVWRSAALSIKHE